MMKRMIIMLIAVGAVLGGIFGFEAFRAHMIAKFFASMGHQPQTVATTVARVTEWQPHLDAVGSLTAVQGGDLSFEVSGIVGAIHFKSGADVAAGTPLVRLRDADDVARLHALQATARLAAITYGRDVRQLRVHAVSQATVDADAATLKSDRAAVAQQQAVVAKKTLVAPYAGHLGIRAVALGQYVNPGTPVVTLDSLDPIYADFDLPQQMISRLKIGLPVTVGVDAYPGVSFSGDISAISPQVDSASRNIHVRAVLRNPRLRLRPGMFARVSIATGAPVSHVTLPRTAITYNPYGSTVFLVEKTVTEDGNTQLTAHQTFVTTGDTRGDQVAILKGVKAGQTVVVAGQMKLRNGVTVEINNKVLPADDAHPHVPDE